MTGAALQPFHPRAGGNVHDLVLEMVPRESGRVLDAAAGVGFISGKLRDFGFDVTCADIHFDEDFPIAQPVLTDFNKPLPFEDETFDGAVSVETIEHLENPWLFIGDSDA